MILTMVTSRTASGFRGLEDFSSQTPHRSGIPYLTKISKNFRKSAVTEKDLYLKIGKPNNACSQCGQPINFAGKHPSILKSGEEAQKPSRKPGKTDQPEAPADTPEVAKAAPVKNGQGGTGPEPEGGPRREDFCTDCWHQLTEKDYLGYWMARREAPKPRKIESRKERNAGVLAWFSLLRTQEPDDDNLQAQFFLAHLLMKYGVLKWQRTDTDDDGNEIIYFRQTGTDDDLAVLAVDLSDEKSVEIKRQLDEFLEQFANREQPETPEVSPPAEVDL